LEHAGAAFMIHTMQAAIFDLDGVIVDTAKYHYLAWKRLARQLGFEFRETDNERLKGISRMRSLEILLEVGGVPMHEADRVKFATLKDGWYVEYIQKMDPSELLPGAVEYVRYIRGKGVKTAIASASKNAPLIIERVQIGSLFDAVIDGTKVFKANRNRTCSCAPPKIWESPQRIASCLKMRKPGSKPPSAPGWGAWVWENRKFSETRIW
jgi:beta-phosphoglucomutase